MRGEWNNGIGNGENMNTYVAFLRGINVGGNSQVSMKELAGICKDLGFEGVRTYLNSGNIILKSYLSEEELRMTLETAISENLGKDIKVIIRSACDLQQMLAKNPFPEAVGSKVGVFLMNESIEPNIRTEFVIVSREQVELGNREVYVHYSEGIGRSKLKWPSSLKDGTMRNINTLTKLANLTGTP